MQKHADMPAQQQQQAPHLLPDQAELLLADGRLHVHRVSAGIRIQIGARDGVLQAGAARRCRRMGQGQMTEAQNCLLLLVQKVDNTVCVVNPKRGRCNHVAVTQRMSCPGLTASPHNSDLACESTTQWQSIMTIKLHELQLAAHLEAILGIEAACVSARHSYKVGSKS